MKKLLATRLLASALLLATLLLGASALGANQLFTFDDSTVDYTDADISKAYLSFSLEGDRVRVDITEKATEASIPIAIDFDVPDKERKDFFGTDVGAALQDIKKFRVFAQGDDIATSNRATGCGMTHLDGKMADAIDAYVAAFQAMGFSVVDRETVSRSVRYVEFTRDDRTVVAKFRQFGDDVQVELDRG